MGAKAKLATIKYAKKKGKEKLRKKILGGGGVGGVTKGGTGKKGSGRGGRGNRAKGPRTERDELRDEEKRRAGEDPMGVDQFLDQDFGGSEDLNSDSGGEAPSSSDDLSDLDDNGLVQYLPEDAPVQMTVGVSSMGKSPEQAQREVAREASQTKDAMLRELVTREVRSHKEELEALKTKDPEFYKYLQESESQLLEFASDDSAGDDGSASYSSDLEEDDGDNDEEGQAGRAARKKVMLINEEATRAWCASALDKGSLSAVKNVLKAYRVGCHYGDEEEETTQISFRLEDSNAFNQLMLFVLRNADGIFRRLLKIEGKGKGKGKQEATARAMQSSKWTKVGPLVKSFLGNTLHLISHVTEAALNAYIYQRLRSSVDLFTNFPVLSKKLLRLCLDSFGSDLGNVKVDRTLRIQSVLLVRALAVTQDDLRDECYKGLHRSFRSCAKFTNQQNISSIRFMQDCVVEVYATNADTMYKHVFNFVKELALLLRTSLQEKTKDAYERVYSWQVIASMELLEGLVSRYGSEEGATLHPMLYPLVQVLMMTATLMPSSRYLPLRFRVLNAILRLSKNSGVFIPVSSIILDTLNFAELAKKPSGAGNYFSLAGILKVPKPVLRTMAFQDQWVTTTVLLLIEHCSLWSHHIAFPELFLPLGVRCKSYLKSTSMPKKFKAKLAQFMEAAQMTAESIIVRRQIVTFSPRDTNKVEMFLKDGRSQGPTPIDRLYDAVSKQASKQEQLNQAEDVLVGGKEAVRVVGRLEDVTDDVEYNKDVISFDKKIQKKKKGKGAATEKAVQEHTALVKDDGKNEDRVEDFEMSESDEDVDDVFITE